MALARNRRLTDLHVGRPPQSDPKPVAVRRCCHCIVLPAELPCKLRLSSGHAATGIELHSTMADQQQQYLRDASQLMVPSRPRVMGRTFSAPLVTSQKHGADGAAYPTSSLAVSSQENGVRLKMAAARLVSNGTLQTESESEVNIAIIGSAGVGKSTFIQQSLGLSSRPTGAVNARRISVDSATYVVRMLECRLDDVIVDSESRISWPLDNRIPRVDAALTLYDVGNKNTFEEVPLVLSEWAQASWLP